MPGELPPEAVLKDLEKGSLAPFYLFFGESGFRLEKVLARLREEFIPEAVRDLNLQVFYGGKGDSGERTGPGRIIDAASSLPFMAQNRLIIVRRTEEFSAADLEHFIPYLERPMASTCLVFVSSKPDFRKKFYKKFKALGRAVNFKQLYDNQLVSWIRRTAAEMGLDMDPGACAYLRDVAGRRMRDLYSELEKLSLSYPDRKVGVDEIKEMATYSRIYTVFELMNAVSERNPGAALSVLDRYLEEEGKEGVFKVIGMLNRQIQLLWQVRAVIDGGGRSADVMKRLHLRNFQARELIPQSRRWERQDLEAAVGFLYETDGLLKSGAPARLVLENLVLSLCRGKRPQAAAL